MEALIRAALPRSPGLGLPVFNSLRRYGGARETSGIDVSRVIENQHAEFTVICSRPSVFAMLQCGSRLVIQAHNGLPCNRYSEELDLDKRSNV